MGKEEGLAVASFPSRAVRALVAVWMSPWEHTSLAWVPRDVSLLLCRGWHLGCCYQKAGGWGRYLQGWESDVIS